MRLGNILHLGKCAETPVELDVNEFIKHVFVTGSTGSGKSNAMYLMLSQLREAGKTFMVVEPAKGEYKHVFGCLQDVTVFSNTHKVGQLLRVNPFSFPYEQIDVLEHIDRLVEIFNACWPMYAAMPAVLKHSIITAYEKCGWDTNASEHKLAEPIFPTFEDVVACLKTYLDSSDFSAEAKGDYKGALQVRLQELCDGMFGKMFNNGSIPDDDLFNKNVIVDLSRIGSSEGKALIMGILIMKLNEFRMAEGGMNRPLRHVMVLEEAHNLLKRTSSAQSDESSNVAGKSVEMISNSIAEMRTYGESFFIVDQSPSLLDTAALRNTNTKIVLSLPDAEDSKVAGVSMSLTDDQTDEIARQKQGEAIVYQNTWELPVQCKIDKFVGQEDFVYNQRTAPVAQRQRRRGSEIVAFLLHPYVGRPIDVASVEQELALDPMPASVEFTLRELLSEHKNGGSARLWDEINFAELAGVVRGYLDIDAQYANMLSQCRTMQQVRVKFDALLKDILLPDLDMSILYYVELCYVKNNALFSEWRETFKA